MTETLHENRNRMEPHHQLQEVNPYYAGNEYETNQMRWRSYDEIEEWCYDQGYNSGIEELCKMLPSDRLQEIGEQYLMEGPDAVEAWLDEEIMEVIDTVGGEYLETYVDGQMRLYAGYDVAENGDTLEEGKYGIWEDLRVMWEAGFQDKLRGRCRYSSIE